MLETIITPAVIEGAKTVAPAIPFLTKCADFFRATEEIRIEWVGPNFRKVTVLWGLFSYEQGERKTFVVRGKPGFCAAVIADLRSNGSILSQSKFRSLVE